MKVTVGNLLSKDMSFSLGRLGPGESKTYDVGLDLLHGLATELKILKDANKISLSVAYDPTKDDLLEVATVGAGVSAVGTAGIADGSVTAAKTAMFVSNEQTGTGSAQNIAHGLGVVPSKVLIALSGGPAAYTQPTITKGAHTTTNVVATVTTGWKYVVMAWA